MRVNSRPPVTDDLNLVGPLGLKGYLDDVPPAQFLRWSLESGLIRALVANESATAETLAARTWLSPTGADVLLGVLVAMDLVQRDGDSYRATTEIREYLDPESPYYLADSLLFSTMPIRLPAKFVDMQHPYFAGIRGRLRLVGTKIAWTLIRLIAGLGSSNEGGWDFGGAQRLENQHQRNLPACVTAANLPLFDGAKCVVDVGGGTGTLALALREVHPDVRVIIADLPEALDGIAQFLGGSCGGIELSAMDAMAERWDLPACDVLFFGNLLHVFGDGATKQVIDRAARHLRDSGGGMIVIHEIVWNADRSGPLKAALFDFTMRAFGGRQRTVEEFHSMMADAGCVELSIEPTTGAFFAISGRVSA